MQSEVVSQSPSWASDRGMKEASRRSRPNLKGKTLMAFQETLMALHERVSRTSSLAGAMLAFMPSQVTDPHSHPSKIHHSHNVHCVCVYVCSWASFDTAPMKKPIHSWWALSTKDQEKGGTMGDNCKLLGKGQMFLIDMMEEGQYCNSLRKTAKLFKQI